MRFAAAVVFVFALAFVLGAVTRATPSSSHVVKGTYTADDPAITTTIDTFYHGRVAGKTVAVAVLRGELPATGYNSSAQAFEVSGGKANHLGDLGDFSYFTEGDGPYPDNWIYVSFADGKLYADVWSHDHRCDKLHDWVVSTYTIRGEKLQRINVLRHHRKGIAVACRAE